MHQITMTIFTITAMHRLLALPVLLAVLSQSAAGAITYTDQKDLWLSQTTDVEVITFTEHPVGTWLDDHYHESHGLIFAGPTEFITHDTAFHDLQGMKTFTGVADLRFDTPITAFAFDNYFGTVYVRLFSGTDMIGEYPFWGLIPNFGGILSTIPFDRIVLWDPSDAVLAIDDIMFTHHALVPGPGGAAMALLAGWSAVTGRRRRRSGRPRDGWRSAMSVRSVRSDCSMSH
ncbi:MAG: hypothetical protein KF817_05695 [Phycisphaeraceae bacterium]|nr:hypothetical protein [Phycisphaeraceae bacterium]